MWLPCAQHHLPGPGPSGGKARWGTADTDPAKPARPLLQTRRIDEEIGRGTKRGILMAHPHPAVPSLGFLPRTTQQRATGEGNPCRSMLWGPRGGPGGLLVGLPQFLEAVSHRSVADSPHLPACGSFLTQGWTRGRTDAGGEDVAQHSSPCPPWVGGCSPAPLPHRSPLRSRGHTPRFIFLFFLFFCFPHEKPQQGARRKKASHGKMPRLPAGGSGTS